ncbi:putative RNA-directed DNA polymerase from transposon BS [Trichonephila clavipes]|nr:putative RNA-directed DNA polymerase from transposon BS [Trichonephila clavipes]
MTRKSPFAIQKAIKGIGGDPKSVKKLRSGDLLLETVSALQTKSFLLAKTFLDCLLTASPHKSLNSSRGVISEPDLICTPEAEILEGFSGQGVIQAGYLNCKIRPYIPNPLRCFKCQRFGHSQTSCRGQLTCSRCASVGHSSTDCTLEPKCFNCSQSHSSDSKLCPKWKIEKQIQEIKTNNNISYQEARTLIAPQLSQTYAQVAKSSTATSTSQTDENITRIKCPPLQLLQPLLSVPQPNKYPSITSVSTSSSTTQANLLPSASSIKPTTKIASRLPKPIFSSAAPDNSLNTSASSLSAETRTLIRSNKSAALSTEIQPLPESDPTASNGEHFNAFEVPQCAKRNSRNRRKRPKVQKAEIKIKMAPHRPRKSTPT